MGKYSSFNKKPYTKAELYKEKRKKVFEMIARGLTAPEIICRLKISRSTLKRWLEEENVTFINDEI